MYIFWVISIFLNLKYIFGGYNLLTTLDMPLVLFISHVEVLQIKWKRR